MLLYPEKYRLVLENITPVNDYPLFKLLINAEKRPLKAMFIYIPFC